MNANHSVFAPGLTIAALPLAALLSWASGDPVSLTLMKSIFAPVFVAGLCQFGEWEKRQAAARWSLQWSANQLVGAAATSLGATILFYTPTRSEADLIWFPVAIFVAALAGGAFGTGRLSAPSTAGQT